jgi:hypothetical protein
MEDIRRNILSEGILASLYELLLFPLTLLPFAGGRTRKTWIPSIGASATAFLGFIVMPLGADEGTSQKIPGDASKIPSLKDSLDIPFIITKNTTVLDILSARGRGNPLAASFSPSSTCSTP